MIFIIHYASKDMMALIPEVADLTAQRDIPGLVALLGSPDPDVKGEAAFALAEIGSAAIPFLIEAFEQGRNEHRSWIAAVLGQIGDERGLEPLIRALREGDAELRTTAARALGMIGSEEAVEPLIAALKDDDPFVRSGSVTALGMLRSRKAVEALGAATRDEKKPVRMQAVWALVHIGDPAALPYLEKALQDPDPDVHRVVENAMKRIPPS